MIEINRPTDSFGEKVRDLEPILVTTFIICSAIALFILVMFAIYNSDPERFNSLGEEYATTTYVVESKQVKTDELNGTKVKTFYLKVKAEEKGKSILKVIKVSPTAYMKAEVGKGNPFKVWIDENGKIVRLKYLE